MLTCYLDCQSYPRNLQRTKYGNIRFPLLTQTFLET